MFNRQRTVASSVATGLIVASSLARAYTLFSLADDRSAAPSGTFSGFLTDPAINNGVVAFEGLYGGQGGHAIYTTAGGSPTLVARIGGAVPGGTISTFGLRGPAISGNNAVFFAGYTANQTFRDGIYGGNGNSLTSLAERGDAVPTGNVTQFERGAAASGGTVAYLANTYRTGDTHGDQGIFAETAGVVSTIATADTGWQQTKFTSFSFPAASGSTVAFWGRFSSVSNFGDGVFTGSGGPLTMVARTNSSTPIGTISALTAPGISGTTAAFRAVIGSTTQAILKGAGGSLSVVAKANDAAPGIGAMTGFSTDVAISGNRVAVVASSNQGFGIFVDNNGVLEKVVTSLDAWLGSSFLNLRIGNFSLDPDNSGRLAFYYELANGRRGIAIATPGSALAGDFDHDGDVDGRDFLVWQRNRTVGNLSDWRTNFGVGGSSSNVATIPEPTSATAALVLAAGVAARFRRRYEFSDSNAVAPRRRAR